MSFYDGKDFNDLFNSYISAYRSDNKIFEKIAILLNSYVASPSWPHSVFDFESEAAKMTGAIVAVSNILEYVVSEDSNFKNDKFEDAPKNFKRDLIDFTKITYDIIKRAYIARNNPFALQTISSTDYIDEGKKIIKISRNDNSALELILDRSDICKIENFFKDMGDIKDE